MPGLFGVHRVAYAEFPLSHLESGTLVHAGQRVSTGPGDQSLTLGTELLIHVAFWLLGDESNV